MQRGRRGKVFVYCTRQRHLRAMEIHLIRLCALRLQIHLLPLEKAHSPRAASLPTGEGTLRAWSKVKRATQVSERKSPGGAFSRSDTPRIGKNEASAVPSAHFAHIRGEVRLKKQAVLATRGAYTTAQESKEKKRAGGAFLRVGEGSPLPQPRTAMATVGPLVQRGLLRSRWGIVSLP